MTTGVAGSSSARTIIVLNDYAYVEGGSSRVALDHARGLAERGYRVILFAAQLSAEAPGAKGWVDGAAIPTWITGQWDIAGNPDRIQAARQGLWNPAAADQLGAILDECDPAETVVLLQNWTKALSSSVADCAIRKGFPVVAVLHSYYVDCPNGAYHDYRKGQHCWRKPMSMPCVLANCDQRSMAQKSWRVVRQLIQRSRGQIPSGISAAVCVSHYQHRIIKPWLPAGLPCHVLPNLVTAPAAIESDVKSNQAFVFVGRLSPEKGALVFAKAAREAGVEAVFVGDGEQAAAVRECLPEARITGWLPHDAVWAEMSRGRALLFPSILRETFGLSVYEAAALGVPSIVSENMATSDFVREGVNGLSFPLGDVAALAVQLRLLADNPDHAARLGARARLDYLEYFRSIANHYEILENILFSVMKQKGETPSIPAAAART